MQKKSFFSIAVIVTLPLIHLFACGPSGFSDFGKFKGFNLLAMGFFLAVVLQHLALFAGGRKATANLFFPIVAGFAALRLALVSKNPLGILSIPPEWMFRLEVSSLFPILPSFLGVYRRLYPYEIGFVLPRGVTYVSAGFICATLVFPDALLRLLPVLYLPVAALGTISAARGMVLAIQSRRSGSAWMILAAASFSLVFLLDLLGAFLSLEGHVYFLFSGWAVVVALVSAGLGRRVQDAYDEAERATEKLARSNEALEAEVHARTRELRKVNEELRLMAETDALTGIANRRRFEEVLHEEKRRSARTGSTLSVGIFDVDYFKSFNDTYGHLEGDECLKKVASVLSAGARRPGDLAARYGGEEFALLLPETDSEGALAMVKSAVSAVENLGIPHEESPFKVVTISAGVASSPGGREDIILEADRALYAAKASGRNAVREALPKP